MGEIKIGIIQIATKKCNTAYNFKRSIALIRKAAKKGANIVCTQECMLDGYAFDTEEFKKTPGNYAIPRSHPYITEYTALAQNLGIGILVGVSLLDFPDHPHTVQSETPRYRNSILYFSSEGKIAGEYHKIHSTFGNIEQEFYTPGNEFPTFYITGKDNIEIRFGIMICYDRQIPEVARILALSGAQILFNPAATGNFARKWNTRLIQTRAYENNCFVVSVNHAYPRLNGRSFVVNPKGKLLTRLPPWESVKVISLNLDERQKSSLLKTRKPDLYTKLIKSGKDDL